MKKRKRMPRGKRNKKIREMLLEGYTYKEIKHALNVGEATISATKKLLDLENKKKEQELELKTKREYAVAELVEEYKELKPVIEEKALEAKEIKGSFELAETKLRQMEDKVESLDSLVSSMLEAKFRVSKKGLEYIEKKIAEGDIDADKLAYSLLKEGK